MNKPDNYYNDIPLRRTLNELHEFASKSKGENYCCVHQPLLNIPLDHIILDELHLMLRITDVLIGNLVEDVMQWDDKESFLTCKKKVHLDKLVQVINSCGVSFSVWEKRNADGKGSGTWDWTSLMGDDRKTLLKALPSKLEPFIQQDIAKTVVELWKVHNLNDSSNMKDNHCLRHLTIKLLTISGYLYRDLLICNSTSFHLSNLLMLRILSKGI